MNKIALLLSALIFSGCSMPEISGIRSSEQKIEQVAVRTTQAIEKTSVITKKSAEISRSHDSWISLRSVKRVEDRLPAEFYRNFSMERNFSTIADIAERITFLSGISVSLAPDVLQSLQSATTPQTTSASPASPQSMPMPGGLMPPAMIGAATGNAEQINVSYNGTMQGFMSMICARLGLSWEYKNGSIFIFRTTTKTFTVYALPGDTSLTASISNQGGSGSGQSSGTSNSQQNAGVTFSSLSVWTALESSVKGMLSSQGKMSIAPATGTLTVTDVPYIVQRIESFIAEQNASMSRQVAINVRVMTVSLNDSDNYGINWNMVYDNLSSIVGATFTTEIAPVPNSASLKLSVLSSSSSVIHGSSAIINALSQQGKVSLVTSADTTTLNNQPVPVQVGQQTAYLASSNTTVTPNVGSTTTLSPGSVTTGFSMNLLPHLLDQGRLLLQYAINISTLDQLVTVSSNGSSIQTPEISTRNFLQRVAVRSGETLVLSGFEQDINSTIKTGVGRADNALMGSTNGKRKKDIVVVLITPVIADRF